MSRTAYASIEIASVSYETSSPAVPDRSGEGSVPDALLPDVAVPESLDPTTEASFVVGIHATDPAVGREVVAPESLIGYRVLPAGTTTPVEVKIFPVAGTVLTPDQRFPPDPGGTASGEQGATVTLAAWDQLPTIRGDEDGGPGSPVETVEAMITGGLDQSPEADPVVNDADARVAYNPVEGAFQLQGSSTSVFDGGPSVSQPDPGTLELTADQQEAGTTATVDVPPTELLSDPDLSLLSLSITFLEAAPIDLTVSAGASGDGFSLPEGFQSVGFFSIDHPAPADDAVEFVRFGFSVDADAIDDPGGLVLFREAEDGVQSLSTQLVSETPTAYHYQAVSSGLSTFGAGVQSSSSNPVDDPNDPENQLWVTLGVPTLLDAESDRPVNGGILPGVGNLVDCQNNADAPIIVSERYDPEDTGFDVPVVDDPPGWLPAALDGDKAYHRVPAVLNVRQTGEISEEIAVNIPTTDAPDGALVAVNDREGDVGNDDAIGGLGFTFSSDEYGEQSLTRKLDLIFVSEGRCNSNTTQSTVLDNIGDLSVSVTFTEGDSTWTEITGSDTHQHGLRYYTPGRSLTEAARQLAKDAMEIWASNTVSAIMPGGPVRMYRAARAVGGAAPLAGPAVELMALWEGLDTVFSLNEGQPLTPSGVLSSTISKVAFGGAGDLPASRFPEFFPGLSNVEGVSDTEIGIYGPSLYFSGERDTSEFGYAAEYYNHARDHPDFEQGSGFGSPMQGLVEPELSGAAPQLSSKGESAAQISQFDWWDRQYLSRTRIDDSIDLTKSNFPLDEGEPLDPNLAAAHWEAVMTVPEGEGGEYTFRTTSDDDSWVFVDGTLVVDNGGLHPSRTVTDTVELDDGDHELDVFFAERQTVGLRMEFVPPSGVEIRPP